MKKVAFIAIASLSVLAFISFKLYPSTPYNYYKELYNPPQYSSNYIIRNKINEYIKQNKSQYRSIIDFYTGFTKNKKISEAIVKYCLQYNMPVNLGFALCYVESAGYNVRAVQKNSNGTIDRGLFQLNSGSRQQWKTEDFFNIDKNCKEGIRFWSEACALPGRSISLSFIAYNMGPYSDAIKASVIPEQRAWYISDILRYEDMLNVKFNELIQDNFKG